MSQQDQNGSKHSEKGFNYICHEITHSLLYQQHQCGSEKGLSRAYYYEITHSLSRWQDQSGSEDSEAQLYLAWNYSLSIKPIGPRWECGQWEDTQLDLAWKCSLSVKPTGSKCEENSEKGPSWTWHEITHILSSQQDHSGNRIVRRDPAAPDMKSLTSCQANRIRVEMRTMRKAAGPGMKSLTHCQANRIRVWVREQWEWTQLDLAWNHSLPIKPTVPECEWG